MDPRFVCVNRLCLNRTEGSLRLTQPRVAALILATGLSSNGKVSAFRCGDRARLGSLQTGPSTSFLAVQLRPEAPK